MAGVKKKLKQNYEIHSFSVFTNTGWNKWRTSRATYVVTISSEAEEIQRAQWSTVAQLQKPQMWPKLSIGTRLVEDIDIRYSIC